jgi:hypothetical protein
MTPEKKLASSELDKRPAAPRHNGSIVQGSSRTDEIPQRAYGIYVGRGSGPWARL